MVRTVNNLNHPKLGQLSIKYLQKLHRIYLFTKKFYFKKFYPKDKFPKLDG